MFVCFDEEMLYVIIGYIVLQFGYDVEIKGIGLLDERINRNILVYFWFKQCFFISDVLQFSR